MLPLKEKPSTEERLAAVDWARLLGMIEELMRVKGIPSLSKLGEAVGSSDSVLYQWRRHKVVPDVETLGKIARYASERPRAPHLAQEWRWLEVAGHLRNPGFAPLRDDQRDLLAIADDLTTNAQREGLRNLALAYLQALGLNGQ